MQYNRWWILVLLGVVTMFSCLQEPQRKCETHKDCLPQEQCLQRICQTSEGVNAAEISDISEKTAFSEFFRCDIVYKTPKALGVAQLTCAKMNTGIQYDSNEYVHSLTLSSDGVYGAFVTQHQYTSSSDPRSYDGRLVLFRLK